MHRTLQVCALLAVALAALGPAGCGERGERRPETGATLEGSITYNKQAVPFALVIVAGDGKGASSTGKADEQGRYKVENAPLGEVSIGVNTDAAEGELKSREMAGYRGPTAKAAGRVSLPKLVKLPPNLQNPSTSNIKTTVNKGANTYDIVLTR